MSSSATIFRSMSLKSVVDAKRPLCIDVNSILMSLSSDLMINSGSTLIVADGFGAFMISLKSLLQIDGGNGCDGAIRCGCVAFDFDDDGVLGMWWARFVGPVASTSYGDRKSTSFDDFLRTRPLRDTPVTSKLSVMHRDAKHTHTKHVSEIRISSDPSRIRGYYVCNCTHLSHYSVEFPLREPLADVQRHKFYLFTLPNHRAVLPVRFVR